MVLIEKNCFVADQNSLTISYTLTHTYIYTYIHIYIYIYIYIIFIYYIYSSGCTLVCRMFASGALRRIAIVCRVYTSDASGANADDTAIAQHRVIVTYNLHGFNNGRSCLTVCNDPGVL